MTETKHTPGPWYYNGNGAGLVHSKDNLVACVYPMKEKDASTMEANSYLIAASPKLLERLEWATAKLVELGQKNDYTLGMVQSIQDCESVIREARSQS